MIPAAKEGRRLMALRLTDPKGFIREVRGALQAYRSVEEAAKALGVARRTMFRWKRELGS